MAFTSFKGPVRSGTVHYGSGVNTGLPILVQEGNIATAALLTTGGTTTIGILPAGARIHRIVIEVTTAITTATNVGITLGDGTTANKFLTSINTGTSAVKVAQATIDAATAVANTGNIGTTDVTIVATTTAATGNAAAGAIRVVIEYVQRVSDGTYNPTNVA